MAQVPQEVLQGGLGSYWKGQDGNVYVYGSQGTNSAGVWDDSTKNYWDSSGYTQISDPNTGSVLSSTTSPTKAPSIGTTSTAPQFKDTSALRNSAQASLDSLGTVQANRYAGEDTSYGNLVKQYGDERATELGKFNDQTADNERTLASGQQAGMLAAAQGGRGLRSVLAAMGALGGTGSILADRAITDSANADLGGARDNFDVNAKSLNTAWGDFDALDKRRKEEADNTRTSNKTAIDSDILTTRQKLFQDMAGYYETAGNTGGYNDYMSRATALTPEIASRSKSMSAYTPVQGGFNPAELATYLAGNKDMSVGRQAGAQGGTALNSPLYASPTKKEKELV